ncbi:hypothetical protein D3C77_552820 [compost metagenome]
MTYAQEIAQKALQRAQERQQNPVHYLSRDNLAISIAEASAAGTVEPILYAAQPIPGRRRHRPRPNLKTMAFAAVLADGAALLAAKAGGGQ